jgi:hypothetical protein
MVNFTVEYKHPTEYSVIESMVYAADANNFLIVDAWGKFKWVPMRDCRLVGSWDMEDQR